MINERLITDLLNHTDDRIGRVFDQALGLIDTDEDRAEFVLNVIALQMQHMLEYFDDVPAMKPLNNAHRFMVINAILLRIIDPKLGPRDSPSPEKQRQMENAIRALTGAAT